MFGVDVGNPWSSEQTLTGHSDQIKGVVPAFRSAFFFFFFSFFLSFFNIHRNGVLGRCWVVLQGWCHVKLLPSRRVLSPRSVYTIQPCTMSRHFMRSHIRRVPACLAVTCHLHCRQNDRGLLCATAVTRGWNGYRNESVQKVDPGEGNFLPPLLPVLEPATF